MNQKEEKGKGLTELSISKLSQEDIFLIDQMDKPFLIVYLFIFIIGIILTILGI